MKDKPTFSLHGVAQGPRYDAMPGMGFPPVRRPVADKAKVKAKGVAAHGAHVSDSAFLAERGCFGRAVPPRHTGPQPDHP